MESPIEIARRVWPGEWANFPAPHMTIGGALFGAVIGTTKADDGWRVYLTTRGLTQRIALNADLAKALIAARQKVSEAILELVRGAGMHPVGVPQERDVAVLDEIIAERQRAFAKWGPQPHRWVDPLIPERIGEAAERLEDASRWALSIGNTWSAIIGEEAGEALREIDPKKARAELIQVAAMCLAALSECPDLQEEVTP